MLKNLALRLATKQAHKMWRPFRLSGSIHTSMCLNISKFSLTKIGRLIKSKVMSLKTLNETALWRGMMGCLFDDGMTCGGDGGERGGVVFVWEFLMFALWCVLVLPWDIIWQLVSRSSWFLFSVFPFSRVQDIRREGSGKAEKRVTFPPKWVYWRSFRYSLALLRSLKKSEASAVVGPVVAWSFLSGWYLRASCR